MKPTASPTEIFFAYAGEFEKSYADDDWARCYPFFHENATYDIIGGRYACTLQGPVAMCAGMKKSLDGMDRRFDSRELSADSEIIEQGNELKVDWRVTYSKQGLPPYVLLGRSEMSVEEGKIMRLSDTFRGNADADIDRWMEQTGFSIDPSYA